MMDWPKINCPRCNALQEFKYKSRKLDNAEHEIYIRCGKCKKEWVVDKVTDAEFARKRRNAKRREKKASERRAARPGAEPV
jgi:hypothetical protein